MQSIATVLSFNDTFFHTGICKQAQCFTCRLLQLRLVKRQSNKPSFSSCVFSPCFFKQGCVLLRMKFTDGDNCFL